MIARAPTIARPPRILAAALLAVATTTTLAAAQPTPPAPTPAVETPEKRKARALFKEGSRLLKAGQAAESLELLREAYLTFPSTVILTNIALAESALGRHSDAANTFQRYLDAPDREAATVPGVEADLAALDEKVGRLRITLDVTDGSEIRIDGLAWFTPSPSGLVRLDPGTHAVAGRRGHQTSPAIPFDVAAGAIADVSIQIIPPPPAPTDVPPLTEPGTVLPRPDVAPAVIRATPRAPGRLGAQAQVLVESTGAGAAGALAATFAATPRLDLIAGGIVGPSIGGFAAARFALSTGALRPTLTGGVPIMIAEGTHVGVRGAAGLTWAFSRRASVIADVAAEYYPSPGTFYDAFMVVPSLGLHGRL